MAIMHLPLSHRLLMKSVNNDYNIIIIFIIIIIIIIFIIITIVIVIIVFERCLRII